MNNLNQVQPIDEYVRDLLTHAKERFGVKVDLENPTRGQRLEVALVMQHESQGFPSMEIMVGRRVSSDEPLVRMMVTQAKSPQDPRRFYEGFAHQYWPESK